MTSTIPALLAPIRELETAATQGPWRTWNDNDGARGSAVETAWAHDADGADTELITDWCSPEDAAFIAQARTDVPRLLAAIEAVAGPHYECVAYADDIPEGGNDDVPEDYERSYCNEDGHDWPCPTIAAVVAALESEA